MKTHKDLNAWKESMLLAKEAYRITKEFPKTETFGLTSQINLIRAQLIGLIKALKRKLGDK